MFQTKKTTKMNIIVDWAAKIFLFPLLFAGLILRGFDTLVLKYKKYRGQHTKKDWYF